VRTDSRYQQVSRVLTRVLLLNLAVAAAKIGFGYATGLISSSPTRRGPAGG
jgi:hypothetical protein